MLPPASRSPLPASRIPVRLFGAVLCTSHVNPPWHLAPRTPHSTSHAAPRTSHRSAAPGTPHRLAAPRTAPGTQHLAPRTAPRTSHSAPGTSAGACRPPAQTDPDAGPCVTWGVANPSNAFRAADGRRSICAIYNDLRGLRAARCLFVVAHPLILQPGGSTTRRGNPRAPGRRAAPPRRPSSAPGLRRRQQQLLRPCPHAAGGPPARARTQPANESPL